MISLQRMPTRPGAAEGILAQAQTRRCTISRSRLPFLIHHELATVNGGLKEFTAGGAGVER
jgi:hypothetical protein